MPSIANKQSTVFSIYADDIIQSTGTWKKKENKNTKIIQKFGKRNKVKKENFMWHTYGGKKKTKIPQLLVF